MVHHDSKTDLPLASISINKANNKDRTGKRKSFHSFSFFPFFRYGEVVPLGSNYLPSYAEGVRSGIKKLGPKLLGMDPCQTRVMYSVMDYELKGHPYVKAPIDMACWDILGKACTSIQYIACPASRITYMNLLDL